MLAGENIIMSRPGDYFNFWSLSALNVNVSLIRLILLLPLLTALFS